MNKKWIILLVGLLLAAIALFAWLYGRDENRSGADQQPPLDTARYTYVELLTAAPDDRLALPTGLVQVEHAFTTPQDDGRPEPLQVGGTLGQDFLALHPFSGIKLDLSAEQNGSFTLKLYKDGPSGPLVYSGQADVASAAAEPLPVPVQAAGRYYAEISEPQGEIGWQTQSIRYMMGSAYRDGQLLPEEERVLAVYQDLEAMAGQAFTATERFNELLLRLPPDFQSSADLRVDVLLYARDPQGDAAAGTLLTRSAAAFDYRDFARIPTGTMPAGDYYVKLVNKGGQAVDIALASADAERGGAYWNEAPLPSADLALGYALTGEQPVPRDNYSDTWTAVDALQRQLATAEQTGQPRENKFVGIFYFQWLGYHDTSGPYNVSEIMAADPDALHKPDSPLWGPEGHFHYWGEPLFGYYRSDDEFVLRKHAQMLADAGVDTVFLDTTNSFTYRENYMTLLRVFSDVRNSGGQTPQVAFLTPFWEPQTAVRQLYDELYALDLYSDLWFHWDEKPLILADPKLVDAELRPFFTFRTPEPSLLAGPRGPEHWGWLEAYPQHVFYDAQRRPEQMTVGVGQNIVNGRLGGMSEPGARGRSYHDGRQPQPPYPTDYGYNVAEQWERALEIDPEFIFITGWNEWIASRFDTELGLKVVGLNHETFQGETLPVMFMDQFDQEFSRDIEPMQGGHGDSYYYQMADYIRRFKGVRPVPAGSAAQTIRIDGDFAEWRDVAPEYIDDIGDTLHRDHPAVANSGTYQNTSGRNDIVSSKVARDDDYVYFYARTHEPLSPHTDADWMQLYIDADNDANTGWHGYDIVVNRAVLDDHTTTVQHTSAGWNWQVVGEAAYRLNNRELELAIPREWLGLESGAAFEIRFKWADNSQAQGDVMAFTVNGDSAPNGRFNYLYRTQ